MSDTTEKTEVNFLNMQDEEILNQVPPEEPEAPIEQETTEENNEVENQVEDNQAEDTDQVSSDEVQPVVETPVDVQEDPATQEESTSKEVKEGELDYKAVYSRIMAPFKANGRDIEVKSVDEAITLMQMGANYNKKMAALKPNMKVLKLLERNQLLDEERLS